LYIRNIALLINIHLFIYTLKLVFAVLQNYYKSSKGNPIITDLTCPLMSDVFKTMDKALNYQVNLENMSRKDKRLS